MKKSIIPEIAKAFLIALVIGYIHPLLGIIAFFVAAAVLSGGSVPTEEMQRIVDAQDVDSPYPLDIGIEYMPSIRISNPSFDDKD